MATIKQIQKFVVTCVIGDPIVRMVDDVVCRKGPPKCVRICLPVAGIQARTRSGGKCGATWEGGRGTNDVDKKGSEEVTAIYQR